MRYIIIKKFGPGDDGWDGYARWAGLQDCRDYYSIDEIHRKSLFQPESVEDWDNCANEDFKTHIITSLDFAKKIMPKFSGGEIVGVIEDPKVLKEKIPSGHVLMGYDVIDGGGGISLLTDWGGEVDGLKNVKFNAHALVDDVNYAYQLRETLRRDFPCDYHAKNCEVWAVYKINT